MSGALFVAGHHAERLLSLFKVPQVEAEDLRKIGGIFACFDAPAKRRNDTAWTVASDRDAGFSGSLSSLSASIWRATVCTVGVSVIVLTILLLSLIHSAERPSDTNRSIGGAYSTQIPGPSTNAAIGFRPATGSQCKRQLAAGSRGDLDCRKGSAVAAPYASTADSNLQVLNLNCVGRKRVAAGTR